MQSETNNVTDLTDWAKRQATTAANRHLAQLTVGEFAKGDDELQYKLAAEDRAQRARAGFQLVAGPKPSELTADAGSRADLKANTGAPNAAEAVSSDGNPDAALRRWGQSTSAELEELLVHEQRRATDTSDQTRNLHAVPPQPPSTSSPLN